MSHPGQDSPQDLAAAYALGAKPSSRPLPRLSGKSRNSATSRRCWHWIAPAPLPPEISGNGCLPESGAKKAGLSHRHK
jgi:hypothetical protein